MYKSLVTGVSSKKLTWIVFSPAAKVNSRVFKSLILVSLCVIILILYPSLGVIVKVTLSPSLYSPVWYVTLPLVLSYLRVIVASSLTTSINLKVALTTFSSSSRIIVAVLLVTLTASPLNVNVSSS